MARSASPGVVERIVHHTAGGKQGRDEKGERRSVPTGIGVEIRAPEHGYIEFLKYAGLTLFRKT